jgi:hypothetical protein
MSSSNPVDRVRAATALAEHADEIRRLRKHAFEDIVEIGSRLVAAKKLCGYGYWLPWLEREFGWSDKTAERFMSLASGKIDKLSNLDLPVSALYLLAAPSTPAEIIEAVAERGKKGERLSYRDIADMTTARTVQVSTTYEDTTMKSYGGPERVKSEPPTSEPWGGPPPNGKRVEPWPTAPLPHKISRLDINAHLASVADRERRQTADDAFSAIMSADEKLKHDEVVRDWIRKHEEETRAWVRPIFVSTRRDRAFAFERAAICLRAHLKILNELC